MRKLVAVSFASLTCLLNLSAVALAQTKPTETSPASGTHKAPPAAPAVAAAPAATPPLPPPAPPVPPTPPHEERWEHGDHGDHADHAEHREHMDHEHGEVGAVRMKDRQERSTKGSDPDVSELKSGRLMRYGVTAGVALAVHVEVPASTGLRGVGASALPYIAAFPGVWTKSQVTRAYCTAKWVGEDGPENAATSAAVKEAIASLREETKRRGEQELGTYYKPLHDNVHDKEPLPEEDAMEARARVWHLWGNDSNHSFTVAAAQSELAACDDALKDATSSSDFPAACATEHVHELVKAYSGWDTERTGRCTWTHIGGYVGLPFAYNVNDNLGGTETVRRHTPFISSGLVFAPSSFISFLLGVTLNNVTRDTGPGFAAHDVVVPAITFGLGGNLDMLGALIPGK